MAMTRILVIGCGVVGAAIAYELSQLPNVQIQVMDRQSPAQASTGAALGVLMGIISHKVKGRTWQLREASIRRYASLIPELQAATQQPISTNPHGILSLWYDDGDRPKWEKLVADRQAQGWSLDIWERDRIAATCPYLNLADVAAATYSPQDGQVHPQELTTALIKAAELRGVTFHFNQAVDTLIFADSHSNSDGDRQCIGAQAGADRMAADWVIVAAGLGSVNLFPAATPPLALMPVLGQAMRLRLPKPLSEQAFQPVINGNDIHILPLGAGDYWVGATVEFPPDQDLQMVKATLEFEPIAARFDAVRQGAIAMCPALARADVVETWHGLRPRPQGQAAPVLQWAMGCTNVFLATGHYRNGVLLAPASAAVVRQALEQRLASDA